MPIKKLRPIEVFTYGLPTELTSSTEIKKFDLYKDVGDVLNCEGLHEVQIRKRIKEFPSFVDVQEFNFKNCVVVKKEVDPNNDENITFVLYITLPEEIVDERINSGTMSALSETYIKIEIIQFAETGSEGDEMGYNIESMPVYDYILNRFIEESNKKLTRIQANYIRSLIQTTLNEHKTEVRRVSWVSNVFSRSKNTTQLEKEDVTVESQNIEPKIEDFRSSLVQTTNWNGLQEGESREQRHARLRASNNVRHRPQTFVEEPEEDEQIDGYENNQEDYANDKQTEKQLTNPEMALVFVLFLINMGVVAGHAVAALNLADYRMEVFQSQLDVVDLRVKLLAIQTLPALATATGLVLRDYIKDWRAKKRKLKRFQDFTKYFVGAGILWSAISGGIANGATAYSFEKLLDYYQIQHLPVDAQVAFIKERAIYNLKVLGVILGITSVLAGGAIWRLRSRWNEKHSE